MDLSGQVAVITGSGAGIGRSLCEGLGALGAAIVAVDIDRHANAETVAAVRAAGGRVSSVVVDIGDAVAVHAAAAQVAEELGRVDLLVNNAARWNDTTLTGGGYQQQVTAFQAALGAGSTGAFHCTAAMLPMIRAAGGGNIVNMLTDHVLAGYALTGAPATGYDCAKFSLLRLTESWAVELKPHGVRVNALSFGAVDTPMLRGVASWLSEVAMRPTDLVQAVLNVLAHGPDGPTGVNYVFGMTRAPRHEHLAGIAAIAPAG